MKALSRFSVFLFPAFRFSVSRFSIFFFFLFLLSSCGDFQDLSFSGIEGVKVLKMSREGIEAEITARIKNPNSTSFKIYKSEFDVTLNGMPAGKAHITKNVKIHGNSEETYTFRIKSDLSGISPADLPKIISIAMSKKAKVGLKGNLKAGKYLVKHTYPVEISRSIPLEGL
jgi:LEA14-like dessication related protein